MGDTGSLQIEQGLELTSLEWLLDHHRTKEEERRRMVADLNLKPGDTILDLGCGPGLWTAVCQRLRSMSDVHSAGLKMKLIGLMVSNLESLIQSSPLPMRLYS